MILIAILCALFWSGLAWIVGLSWMWVAAIFVGVFAVAWLGMALVSVGAGRSRP
jgi:hypothetical protein